ncbi:YfgM family protein [Nitrosomonas aestuarii]|uniref:Ancillary SecYEG translocon subunit n=1 Tax=Nitrosomonas aestuarii TaxID=52441 RepID=A0A1I4F2S3_9PROT|nr:tetratricopeptide repeat protein [Nitrosomonas aestuarii]PTN11594.1 putative negative regulator of RcsB-dependent stress response [Nitrosomonas aestuarii]SFL12285.1 Putative negative regulator of RcsB-dependent stress response [Nitrosomonas aestuarii]
MATYNREEEDKIEGIKAWWNRFGTAITVVLAVMMATFGGTQVWKYYQQQQAQQAADLYVLLKQVQTTEDFEKISDAAHLLTEGYPSSGYAPRAALIAARSSIKAGDMQRAKTQLQWILDHAKEPEMKDLARLRLASVLFDEENYNEALRHLNTKHIDSFSGLYDDLKGDVLLASGKIEEARLSYQAAINNLNKNNSYFNIVQMKLDALGESD